MPKYVLVFLFLGCVTDLKAQNIWNRLKQKAEQAGEKVIDKTVDDLINGEAPKPNAPAPMPEPTNPGKASENEEVYSGKAMETPMPAKPADNMIHTDTVYAGLDTVYHFNTLTIKPKEFVEYALTLK